MKSPALTLAIAIALAAGAAVAQSSVPAEREQDRWNLADIYLTVDAWNADHARVESQIPQILACKGKLGESAKKLRECLALQDDVLKRYYRLAVYANELYAEDTGKPESLGLRQKAQVLGAKLTEARSFGRPEILAVGRAKIDAFMREEPALATHRHPLDDILRAAPHTLDAAGEAIVASFALSSRQSGAIYTSFSNADMPWPTVKLSDGKEVRLDQSAYEKHRQSANRADRKLVMDAFFGKWKEFERTMGVSYYGNLKEDAVYTKVRKYASSSERALDANRIPTAVYDALIKATNDNLPTLHRYFRLRAKMLGVTDLAYYDIYPPLTGAGREYPIDEGVRIMLESVKPLGPEYVAAMRKGTESRWMDVYPRPRKQSGAHMAGFAVDVHPYVLMNYTNEYSSVATLAHEWGHAMHSYLSNRAQPFATAGYATFTAEIASTTNERLLLAHSLAIARNDEERLIYLGSALERMRATFFRQAMFAEFEHAAHAIVDKGQSLTGAQLTAMYRDLLRKYHGHDKGVMRIDDLYAIEWAWIPHFYRAFYVFQYATSITAGTQFAEDILAGKPGARERYLALISSGGSDYPYELVKKAGVDLATSAPYDAIARGMERVMDEIEALLAKKK